MTERASRAMKLLHYLTRFNLADGGVVRAVLDMCALLADRGHEVEVLTCDDSDVPESWKQAKSGVPRVSKIPPPALPGGLFSRSQLAPLRAKVRQAEVVHLHACWTTSNNQLARMAGASGTPYVLSVHGMLDDWCMAQKTLKKRIYLALGGRRTLEEAALVHCTAEAELEQSRKWYPRGTGIVVPLIFDLEPYRKLPGPGPAEASFGPDGTGDIDPNRPVVLFLSRLHFKKGVDVLVHAAAELKRRGVIFRVLIAGTGEPDYERQIRSLIDRLGLGDDVRLLGLVTGVTKVSLYERAAVLALPTSQENFGFVFPESLACRTPVVTTRGVDIWAELEASGGAVIVERTAEAFAEAIASLLADEDRRQVMGERGRAWVLEHLDPNAIAARFEQMYERARGIET
ncbi:MAG: glycosyltransferase [Phycisphaerales bacterium]